MSHITDLIVRSDEKSTHSIEQRVIDLNHSIRLIENTLNLISDVEIKGAYVKAVAEMVTFWEGLKGNLKDELNRIQPVQVSPPVDATK